MDFRSTPNQHHQPTHKPAAEPHHAETAVHPAATGDKMLRRRKQLILWAALALLLIAAIASALYFNKRYHDSQQQVNKLKSNPSITAQQEQQDLVSKVGKLTVLPTNETPTIATVTDITKLKDQAFFANAKNGDKVLIYTQAKKAYLYRPSTNKLINIAPVNLGNNQTSTTGTTQPTTQTTTNKKP